MRWTALLLVACGGSLTVEEEPTGPNAEPRDSDGIELVPSARADLRLKRWRQLSLDLQGALELPEDEVCRETGLYDCSTIHVVPLGGVSIANGLFEPVDELSATTGLAIERVILQACDNRLQADLSAIADDSDAVVFSHVDLDSGTLSEEEGTAQVSELYRRLLARDPVDAELTAVVGLHTSVLAAGGDTADWAVMACFSIATTTEALTY